MEKCSLKYSYVEIMMAQAADILDTRAPNPMNNPEYPSYTETCTLVSCGERWEGHKRRQAGEARGEAREARAYLPSNRLHDA
jgi:hypothetical protein